MIKNLLPFLGCSAIVLIAIYGIKGDGKKPAGVHIEKVFEDLDENNSFLTLAEDISKEFNIDLDMTIYQLIYAPNEKQHRVGKCTITFHATPIDSKRSKRISV